MDAARWIIVGIVVLMMCSTLGALYKLNKQVLYVYEDEEQPDRKTRPNIVVVPAETRQNELTIKRAGPLPSFAFVTADDAELALQFRQGDERRRGLKELAALASGTTGNVPVGGNEK